MASFKPPIWRLALPAVPLPSCAETALQLREPFAQFVELRPPFGERGFESFHDVVWGAAAKRLVLEPQLLRSDVLREPIDFLAQARDFGLNVNGSFVRDE